MARARLRVTVSDTVGITVRARFTVIRGIADQVRRYKHRHVNKASRTELAVKRNRRKDPTWLASPPAVRSRKSTATHANLT